MEEKNYGFIKSELDGTEIVFSSSSMKGQLPFTYSYKKFLPTVINQGNEPICVPCSISSYLNWKENLYDGSKRDNHIDYHQIYSSKTTHGEGMTFKDALKFLRHEGVNTKNGVRKIASYALINDIQSLKYAIVMNGPCLGALPVYSNGPEFWDREKGTGFYGYHAISIVGYNKEGFIIRNSWGTEFANKGYTCIKYEDAKNFIELWTIIE